MNRRGFLGRVGAFVAAPAIGAVASSPAPLNAAKAVPIVRANGMQFILGVAMENVQVGDLVQIKTYEPFSEYVYRRHLGIEAMK